jgi:hypothetical protein
MWGQPHSAVQRPGSIGPHFLVCQSGPAYAVEGPTPPAPPPARAILTMHRTMLVILRLPRLRPKDLCNPPNRPHSFRE